MTKRALPILAHASWFFCLLALTVSSWGQAQQSADSESSLEVGSSLDSPLEDGRSLDLYRPASLNDSGGIPSPDSGPVDPKRLIDEELGAGDNFGGDEALTLSGKEEPDTISTGSQPNAPASTVKQFTTSDTSAIVQSIVDEFEQLERALFITQHTTRADQPAFRHRGKLSKFQLYFVTGAPPGDLNSRDLQHLANYFLIDDTRATRLSQEALEYVGQLLEEKPFQLFTKWEKVAVYGEESPYYAFIYVDGRPLEEYLIEKGLVRLDGERSLLPDGTKTGDYLRALRDSELKARKEGMGGWKSEERAEHDDRRILD